MATKIHTTKKHARPGDEITIVMRDPEQLYSHREVVNILQKASDCGFSLEKNSPLEKLTIAEVDLLVNRKRNLLGRKEIANLRKAIKLISQGGLRGTYADRLLRVDLYRSLATVKGQ